MNKWERGTRFEEEAVSQLQETLVTNFIYDYYLIPNVPYKGINNRVEQIDCVLICEKGIFCIEFKNWNCTIQPSNKERWIVYGKSNVETSYYNPVEQNLRHCVMLKHYLSSNSEMINRLNIPIFNMVIFSDNTKIKAPDNPDIGRSVMHLTDCAKFIQEHDCKLSSEICEDAFSIVRQLKKDHIEEYKKLHKNKGDD